jgi:hypothetical protein
MLSGTGPVADPPQQKPSPNVVTPHVAPVLAEICGDSSQTVTKSFAETHMCPIVPRWHCCRTLTATQRVCETRPPLRVGNRCTCYRPNRQARQPWWFRSSASCRMKPDRHVNICSKFEFATLLRSTCLQGCAELHRGTVNGNDMALLGHKCSTQVSGKFGRPRAAGAQ